MELDENTRTLAELVLGTDAGSRPDLVEAVRRAFADYAAAFFAGEKEGKVQRLAGFLGTRPGSRQMIGFPYRVPPENAALLYGFASHYLDFDDAQADVMGHLSTVLFSVLLAAVKPGDRAEDFISAYLAGAETAGILGRLVNPAHKRQGYHPTATLGHLGAAAALARLRKLTLEEAARLLSLTATQAAGLEMEAGTDTKPLHPGFAARNALFSWELLRKTGLTSSTRPLNPVNGWVKTVTGKDLVPSDFTKHWLAPGEMIDPGLWMKAHPFCSAAISGAAGCEKLYDEGFRMENLAEVVFHFMPGADVSLHYIHPGTGQEGRFSMEYVGWQIFRFGEVRDSLFLLDQVPEEFEEALPLMRRVNDLPREGQAVRHIAVTVKDQEGRTGKADVRDPAGSPERPFMEEELQGKLSAAAGNEAAARILQGLKRWPDGTGAEILALFSGL